MVFLRKVNGYDFDFDFVTNDKYLFGNLNDFSFKIYISLSILFNINIVRT